MLCLNHMRHQRGTSQRRISNKSSSGLTTFLENDKLIVLFRYSQNLSIFIPKIFNLTCKTYKTSIANLPHSWICNANICKLDTYLVHRFRGEYEELIDAGVNRYDLVFRMSSQDHTNNTALSHGVCMSKAIHVSRVCFNWDPYPPPMPVVTCGTARAFKSLQGKGAESLYCESTQWKWTHEFKDWKPLVLTLTKRRCASSSSYAHVTSHSVSIWLLVFAGPNPPLFAQRQSKTEHPASTTTRGVWRP